MKHIAITGGIGSGKSFVCRQLENYGIKVYDCDQAAKRLWATDETLQRDLKAIVGDGVYINNVLQKRVLAQYLLKSEANKLTVDNLIHPVIARDFLQSGYSWLESAILFDSGFYKRIDFDFIVCVSAPLETRVQRVMERDGITESKALEWIHKQWPQEKVEQHSNFVIVNDGVRDLDEQIEKLIDSINNN
jgi:dephospho-CoA kinase